MKLAEEIKEYKYKRMYELLSQCTQKQQDFFKKLYPNGPSETQFNNAVNQIERTIENNANVKRA